MISAVALLVAGGRGERLGSDGPKAFVNCGGRPMLEWSLGALTEAGLAEIVVALPAGADAPAGVIGVEGGEQRSHSVRNALAAAPEADIVLVHDAARPMLTAEIVLACLAAMVDGVDAAIAAAPITDTVKEGEDGVVVATLDRSRLWAVQTPQVFRREMLERVLGQSDEVLAEATDDASLVEAAGGVVRLVPAPRTNFKVTLPEDLHLADMLLRARST
jgi:2-C-methyl-D-erythritol 4-phosphate cytidylyltransferase